MHFKPLVNMSDIKVGLIIRSTKNFAHVAKENTLFSTKFAQGLTVLEIDSGYWVVPSDGSFADTQSGLWYLTRDIIIKDCEIEDIENNASGKQLNQLKNRFQLIFEG